MIVSGSGSESIDETSGDKCFRKAVNVRHSAESFLCNNISQDKSHAHLAILTHAEHDVQIDISSVIGLSLPLQNRQEWYFCTFLHPTISPTTKNDLDVDDILSLKFAETSPMSLVTCTRAELIGVVHVFLNLDVNHIIRAIKHEIIDTLLP